MSRNGKEKKTITTTYDKQFKEFQEKIEFNLLNVNF